jgi:hypothetical protein
VSTGEPDEVTQERIARNNAAFRAANERIRETAEEYEITEKVPFFCECADPQCREIVQLSRGEYEEVRADPKRFFEVQGHEALEQGAGVVVDRRGGYVILEKIGRAGEVATQLDERGRV